MSDLKYLFNKQSKDQPQLSKRLFNGQQGRGRERASQPQKYSPQQKNSGGHQLAVQTLAKKYLPKSYLKKELALYNSQILLSLIRKIFFFMVVVVMFNFGVIGGSQVVLLLNLGLALCMLDVGVGVGGKWIWMGWEGLRAGVYCANFVAVYRLACRKEGEVGEVEMVVAIAAGMNYGIVRLFEPLLVLRGVKNNHKPYLSFIQKTSQQFQQYLCQMKTLFHLRRPLITSNLSLTFLILSSIIYSQNNTLFSYLFNFNSLRAYISATILLHIYTFILKLISRKISIELISINKKEINMNLLRLDGEEGGNGFILFQLEKYIFNSCENIWDVDFLAHRYAINYDLIQNYLVREVGKIESKVEDVAGRVGCQDGERGERNWGWQWVRGHYGQVKQVVEIVRLIKMIEGKRYIFYVIEQMRHFEELGTTCPLHLDKLLKSIQKIAKKLENIQGKIKIYQFQRCLSAFEGYISSILASELE